MTAGNLTPWVLQWARTQCLDLSDLDTLLGSRVYRLGEAPPEVERPFLELGSALGLDKAGVAGARILTSVRFDALIRMPQDSPFGDPLPTMMDVMALVDQALHRQRGQIEDVVIAGCVREAEIGPRPDPDHFLMLGATYRAQAYSNG